MPDLRPDIILHVGAHRTGTTSLQSALQRNGGVLAQGNITFWGPKKMRVPELRDYFSEPADSARNLATQSVIAGEMSDLFQSGCAGLVISEENLLGTMEHNFRTQSLYATAEEKLRSYATVLGDAPKRVVLTLRGYAEYWQSSYVFRLMSKQRVQPLDVAGLVQATAGRGWVDVVADIRAVFSQSEIILLRHARGQSFIQAAAKACVGEELANQLTYPEGQSNGSLSQEAMAVLQVANQTFGGDWPQQMRPKLLKRLRGIKGTPFNVFSDAQRQYLDELYQTDCARLAAGQIADVTLMETCGGVV